MWWRKKTESPAATYIKPIRYHIRVNGANGHPDTYFRGVQHFQTLNDGILLVRSDKGDAVFSDAAWMSAETLGIDE